MLRNILVCLVLLGCAGCTRVSNKADRPDDPTFDRDPYEKVLLLIVDKSSSFSDLMKPGGKGLAFVNATIEELFRGRSDRKSVV